MAKAKSKKPRENWSEWAAYIEHGKIVLDISCLPLKPKKARKIGAWLIKAADYIESREGK